jgi:hypothetical protein
LEDRAAGARGETESRPLRFPLMSPDGETFTEVNPYWNNDGTCEGGFLPPLCGEPLVPFPLSRAE